MEWSLNSEKEILIGYKKGLCILKLEYKTKDENQFTLEPHERYYKDEEVNTFVQLTNGLILMVGNESTGVLDRKESKIIHSTTIIHSINWPGERILKMMRIP